MAFDRQQFIGQHQLRAAYLARRQIDLALGASDTHRFARDAEESPEATLAFDAARSTRPRLKPANRSKSASRVNGRSIPGELTSSV